jgi:hypothetical protein
MTITRTINPSEYRYALIAADYGDERVTKIQHNQGTNDYTLTIEIDE